MRVKRRRCRKVLYEGFNGSMEWRVYAASLVGKKEVKKEMKLLYSWEGILAAKCPSEKCTARLRHCWMCKWDMSP